MTTTNHPEPLARTRLAPSLGHVVPGMAGPIPHVKTEATP